MTNDTVSSADRDAIERTLATWAEAIRSGDAKALVSLIAEDAEFWTHGVAPMGRDAATAAFGPLFANYELEQDFDCLELVVAGEWAFMRGTETNRLKPKAGGDPIVRVQRAFSVLRRDPDGTWRFARGMTNLPPAQ